MISIIIPVYNQAEEIKKCFDSILLQSYSNYEIIVVNDGSSDNIDEVIKNYQTKFAKFIYISQRNQGACITRNNGAKEAKGDYLIFCDADVIMDPKMLETMLQTLENNSQASFCYSSFLWGKKLFKLWPYDAEKLKQMPYITTTSLIKKEHFPGLDNTIKKFQDWDLWLTMSEQGHSGIWVDKVLFKIQLSGTQTMSSWLPSFAYKFMPWLKQVKKYNKAKEIIKQKHKLK
ncbi:MAG: glycosyltransferase family A protein [bacterium]|nr:glycosyltransferase family A protein [bacterium]